MDVDTTDPSYWLNWRFLICALFMFGAMAFASFLIWKDEGGKKGNDGRRELGYVPVGVLYEDEVWKPCLKSIHPIFLLAFRIFAFCLLFSLITSNAIVKGPGIFFFYTQWTFTLTTIYFGLASGFSIYGCLSDHDEACRFKWASQNIDAEQGSNVSPKLGGSANTPLVITLNNQEVHIRQIAGSLCYLLQIMYQVTAGAVLLTDVVFWLVIYPFLTPKDFKLEFFHVSMHSVNILILVDAILNSFSFVSDRVFYFVDCSICYMPMDNPCMCLYDMAILIHGLITNICSSLVCASGFGASSMLWYLCVDSQVEAPMAFKIVFRILSRYQLKRNQSVSFGLRQIYPFSCIEYDCRLIHFFANQPVSLR